MDPANIYGDFFRGLVRFVGQGLLNTKYSLVANGTIIKVKNGTHVRLIENQPAGWGGVFPDQFEVIAPMDAVTIVSGTVPENYVHYLPASEYLTLRLIYQGV